MLHVHNFVGSEPNTVFLSLEIPLISTPIPAGFPSPAGDFIDLKIDLNRDFIQHPSSTYFAKVTGDSMINAGISDGDLIIVDRSLTPKSGDIAVCLIDGEFTIKRIQIQDDCCWLIPENPAFKPIQVTEFNDFQIWGIVAHSIKSHIL
jgi:DNA polymerase V